MTSVSERREIVCLANSKKHGDYCFAGIDVKTRQWVRPTGRGEHGAVRRDEQRLEDRKLAAPLDVVRIPLGRPAEAPGQPENRRLVPGKWTRAGRLSAAEARKLLDSLTTTA